MSLATTDRWAPSGLKGELDPYCAGAMNAFFLSSIALISRFFPADLVRGVVWVAIISANTYHLLDDRALGARYASSEVSPPDELRRPVSRAAIAASLGMPGETCRRHINALIADGMCLEVEGGVIVPAAMLESAASKQAIAANLTNLKTLLQRIDGRI